VKVTVATPSIIIYQRKQPCDEAANMYHILHGANLKDILPFLSLKSDPKKIHEKAVALIRIRHLALFVIRNAKIGTVL